MNTPTYLGIDHLGVAVRDIESAQATYQDVLGFVPKGVETLPDRGLTVCMVETGNSRLELLAPTRENSEISRFLERRGEGLHHVCLRVENIEQALKQLKDRGARLIDDKPRPGAHGTQVAFLHPKGSCGVLIELVEIPRNNE